MHTKKIALYAIWTVLIAMLAFSPGVADAKSMTLKVSHQFAAGDVRDKMAKVFGDFVTEHLCHFVTYVTGKGVR